jgi:hypothetical protein
LKNDGEPFFQEILWKPTGNGGGTLAMGYILGGERLRVRIRGCSESPASGPLSLRERPRVRAVGAEDDSLPETPGKKALVPCPSPRGRGEFWNSL